MKKILITGGFGILGASLSNFLYSKGLKIFILYKSKKKKNFFSTYINQGIKRIHGDLKILKHVKSIIKKEKINTIIHLGAITQVIESYKNPYDTFQTNIIGTVNILEAVRVIDKNIKVIFSSTDKAYGKMIRKSFKESDPLRGDFPYDVSKSSADLIAQSYAKTYGLQIGIFRSSNIYGPADLNMDRLIPGTILSALKGKSIKLRTSGKLRRDYLFVDDVSAAYYRLILFMQRNIKRKTFIYNLGSKFNFTSLEVVKKIYQTMKINLKPIILNNSSIEIVAQKLNYEKAKKELRWSPHTNFTEGLKRTLDWYKHNYKYLKKY